MVAILPPTLVSGIIEPLQNQVWRESVSLNDLRAYPARAYFERRRVKKAAMSACDLRFHCALNYVGADGGVLGTYGAVLALV